MTAYTKLSIGMREKVTHRVLYHLYMRTSPKHPEWRDITLKFMYKLFETMNTNPSVNVLFHRDDGLRIYSGSQTVAYLQFYQRHFLIHSDREYLIWTDGDRLFASRHEGSFPRMWKVRLSEEVHSFLKYLSELPSFPVEENKASRTIPAWVQDLVYERDGGRCVACGAHNDLCFDHILPFSRGGSSAHPNNLQLLCRACNLEKSANFWPVKITG